MEIRLFALCCGLVLLAGCGSAWVKPGANQQDFYADQSTCVDESQKPGGPAIMSPLTGMFERGTYTNSRLFSACMVDHGWSQGDS